MLPSKLRLFAAVRTVPKLLSPLRRNNCLSKIFWSNWKKNLSTSSMMSNTKNYTIPNSVPVCKLDCKTAFDCLTQDEKKYAHYLSLACHQGGLVVLLQTSPEAPAIFMLLQRLFSEEKIDELKANSQSKDGSITDEDFQSLITYAAGFYSNMGNYKSFGDTKIIPAISKEKFQTVCLSSQAHKNNQSLIETLWNSCSDAIYKLDGRTKELGLGDKGLSTYYSSNICEEDVSCVQEFMKTKKISPYNTRLFKTADNEFELRLASSAGSDKCGPQDNIHTLLGEHSYQNKKIKIIRGDYSYLMKRIVDNLVKAKEFAANDNERQMIECYILSFETGSIDEHKNGSRFWIRDKGPVVETYIGFIESYRDPYGVRGEFEGFVSMVNKAMSEKFGTLVDKAEELLTLLPWPSEYEKDTFLRPDFTSLDVLTFAGSGIPAGINIPNYDDIRQNEGFKNVSLGNVLQSHTKDQVVTFLTMEDQNLYSELKGPSFEVQVGLHELLGHGSGKLFQEDDSGNFNFNKENVLHLETKQMVSTWYKHGETWDTKFSSLASSYEECRAECVGLHLCLDRNILKIFGHEGEKANDILYINWLNMVRAGLLGLEFYSPETKAWKQAHMNARFVILQVLIEAGSDFVKIQQTTGEDGNPDLLITMDRSKIETVGKEAIANFLMRLQLYKATADVEAGTKMYQHYSSVNDEMMERRTTVLARKQPRRMFVQSNTHDQGDVQLEEYEGKTEELIQSFVKRYPQHDTQLEELWRKEQKFHNY